MYHSCLLIDVGDNPDRPRPGRLWLRNRYHVHQRLYMAFPSSKRRIADPDFLAPFRTGDFGGFAAAGKGKIEHEPRSGCGGFLYRIDPLPGGTVAILVQSGVKPDWDYAFHNAGFLLACPPQIQVREIAVGVGDRMRFRVEANATHKTPTPQGADGARPKGARIPVRPENVSEWLHAKGRAGGFEPEQITSRIGYAYFGKDERSRARLFSVRYDGVLRVTDPELLVQAIESGIGPGKAFGFGLLSVAPLRE